MTIAAIKKLKQRIRELERKEAQSRKKLKAAMQHAEKLTKGYRARLKSTIREMKVKHAFNTAFAYARAAFDVERKMLKQAAKKGKALMTAMIQMDKEQITRVVKECSKKAVKKRSKRN